MLDQQGDPEEQPGDADRRRERAEHTGQRPSSPAGRPATPSARRRGTATRCSRPRGTRRTARARSRAPPARPEHRQHRRSRTTRGGRARSPRRIRRLQRAPAPTAVQLRNDQVYQAKCEGLAGEERRSLGLAVQRRRVAVPGQTRRSSRRPSAASAGPTPASHRRRCRAGRGPRRRSAATTVTRVSHQSESALRSDGCDLGVDQVATHQPSASSSGSGRSVRGRPAGRRARRRPGRPCRTRAPCRTPAAGCP